MTLVAGIDLGSTTTKAVLMDGTGHVLGRGITNSRSNYYLATRIALEEARVNVRFSLLWRELDAADSLTALSCPPELRTELVARFRLAQFLASLELLRCTALEEADAPRLAAVAQPLRQRLELVFQRARNAEDATGQCGRARRSDFFRDEAASRFSTLATELADKQVTFDLLMGVFDKAITRVENNGHELPFEPLLLAALKDCRIPADTGPEPETSEPRDSALRARLAAAVRRVAATGVEPAVTIGTGYGRQRLPFAREQIRSEILCHGLGAHAIFPATRTVLDIGGQDTKAIQLDGSGLVTSFQMNDRCAAGCGRYLGYIADEMSLGVHELGPLAQQSTRRVKITSTCTVFAGAELRDRLTLGQRREDILAGLHRAMILRAMALLARSGGIADEFTFTGGVAKNAAAVEALRKLVAENYGPRTLNISDDSIYTGALGAALFALRGPACSSAAGVCR